MDTAQQIITLITAFFGLCGTAAGAFIAIKQLIKSNKENTFKQSWELIMKIADAAMSEAEKTGASGADKKAQVIAMVKAGCKAANVDIDNFVDQLSAYIDDSIAFVNKLTKK